MSLLTQINKNISASTEALLQINVYITPFWFYLPLLLAWCVTLWKKVCLAECPDHLNHGEKEHFTVMIRPWLTTTTLPQHGCLETGSVALRISSINIAPSPPGQDANWSKENGDGLVESEWESITHTVTEPLCVGIYVHRGWVCMHTSHECYLDIQLSTLFSCGCRRM